MVRSVRVVVQIRWSNFSAQDIRELLTDFKLITSGSSILDLGCAPGAWLQVACQSLRPPRNGGSILGIDMKKGSSCALRFKSINCLC
ncbi:ribosomal RNA large subunit methyltransferase E isoform X3 [Cucumis melo var. makuwa]|uniref:Ribosomal RNA large subunit methyltransferase E isoform X3 n=1 Tax=Cucumis melo var. makuwa TaxID=1194695 RepID=A0A5A7V018_CUCMM|nr:ribosomal RNA large subunit methyltransferase E isoform X3 [Cucumis melo var. makuwa]